MREVAGDDVFGQSLFPSQHQCQHKKHEVATTWTVEPSERSVSHQLSREHCSRVTGLGAMRKIALTHGRRQRRFDGAIPTRSSTTPVPAGVMLQFALKSGAGTDDDGTKNTAKENFEDSRRNGAGSEGRKWRCVV